MCTTAVGGLFGGLEPWRSSSDQVLELYQAVMHLTGRRSVQRPANMQAGRGSRDERQLMPELRKNRLGTEHARDCVDRCVHRSWVGHLRRGGDQHLRCGYPGPGRREFRGHSDHRAGGGDTASAAFSAAGWPDGVGCAALDSGAVHRGRSGGNSRRQQYVGGAFRAAGSGGRLSWCSRNIAVCDHVVRSLRDTCGPNPPTPALRVECPPRPRCGVPRSTAIDAACASGRTHRRPEYPHGNRCRRISSSGLCGAQEDISQCEVEVVAASVY
ncbi:Uncharacterised protein [Nocardia otitidiscaviarum]|uniref:Uncharacterized protein n=1 Tax=Nocardia otitidiscaviarum TaxID=1823 RepID=A0A378Y6J2_9NOCA|nr:Uncharacterised protein [Nocardia otitidiscaviarum]